MPSFDEYFFASNGQPITYKGNLIALADKFPVSSGDRLKISIEKTNSEFPQGVSIDILGSCEVKGKIWKKGKRVKMLFWEDSKMIDPQNIEITVFTKEGYVWVQNIWERINSYVDSTSTGEKIVKETKLTDSGHHGAAMKIEEIPNGRRYYCNDGHPDENFDDIVFTVQKIQEQEMA